MFQPIIATVFATAVLSVFLAAISWIDARSLRIPDALSLPLVGFGILWAAGLPDHALMPHLIGATLGFAVLAIIGHVYFRRNGTEGLGLGDAKLFAASGAWLGWEALPQVLLIAAATGLAFALVRRRNGAELSAQIPFGPWIALGMWLIWMYQNLASMI